LQLMRGPSGEGDQTLDEALLVPHPGGRSGGGDFLPGDEKTGRGGKLPEMPFYVLGQEGISWGQKSNKYES